MTKSLTFTGGFFALMVLFMFAAGIQLGAASDNIGNTTTELDTSIDQVRQNTSENMTGQIQSGFYNWAIDPTITLGTQATIAGVHIGYNHPFLAPISRFGVPAITIGYIGYQLFVIWKYARGVR